MSDFTIIALMAESNHGKDFCGNWIVDNQNFLDIAFADQLKRLTNSVLEFGIQPLWGDARLRNQSLYVDWDRAEHRLVWFLDDWIAQINNLSPEEKADYKPTVFAWLSALRLKAFNSLTPNQISPRIALQLLGTEYGRTFKKSIWSSFVLDVIAPEIRRGKEYKKSVGLIPHSRKEPPAKGIIVTDCRFSSELSAVQTAGGYVVKIIRNSMRDKPNEALASGVANHVSELELQSIPDEAFDLILAMDDGADNVYPRLQKMFDTREFEERRKSGATPWKPSV